MAPFPPAIWVLLAFAAVAVLIACAGVLSTLIKQKTRFQDLKIEVLRLRIRYLAHQKAITENEDPFELPDDYEILARYLAGLIPYEQAAQNRSLGDTPTRDEGDGIPVVGSIGPQNVRNEQAAAA